MLPPTVQRGKVAAELRSSVGSLAAQLVTALLQLDPPARPSAVHALHAPFFDAEIEDCSPPGKLQRYM